MIIIENNKRFKGVLSLPFYNLDLLIKEVYSDNTFNGEMLRIAEKNVNISKAKIKGKFTEESVYFVEYELIVGEGAHFPTIYKGTIINFSISGTAQHSNSQSTFYLEKV